LDNRPILTSMPAWRQNEHEEVASLSGSFESRHL
jgi:hypothetical protein